MLIFHVKELMLEIKYQQSFNPKSEWTQLLIWLQICPLIIFKKKFNKSIGNYDVDGCQI